MQDPSTGLVEASGRNHGRILGRYGDRADGPSVVILCGIHGNEPAGVRAAERVIAVLEQRRPEMRGRLALLAGNLVALQDNTRFIHKDLNRIWTRRGIDEGRGGEAVEDLQQRELLEVLRQLVAGSRTPVYFLDLHTSSAEGPPFLTIGDTLRNRNFALRFPLPVILGLEEQVDGGVLEFMNNTGAVTLGVEAGHHTSEDSVRRHEAVLWLTLVHAGLIDAGFVPDLAGRRRMLADASRGIPRIVEVRRRHRIEARQSFRMEPGFRNFQPIRKGQLLARDAEGPLLAQEDGLVLLPLYQGKGDDGYFIAREVRMFWLMLSFLLRRLRLGQLLSALPGVRRDPQRPEVLQVDTRIARWYPLEIFHLFGFRRIRREGATLMVSRRVHDLYAPARVDFPD